MSIEEKLFQHIIAPNITIIYNFIRNRFRSIFYLKKIERMRKTFYKKFDIFMEEEKFYKKIGNLMLTDRQIKVLNRYQIDYQKFHNIKELIFYLEYYLNNDKLDDLEQVSEELSELYYYNYTNK